MSIVRVTPMKRLDSIVAKLGSSVCVGIDPNLSRMPDCLKGTSASRVQSFCSEIIAATLDTAAAYKFQHAYFAAMGLEFVLADCIQLLRNKGFEGLIILDAKRGDIDETARFYAKEAFERYDADLVTVNPYLGLSSIMPFLEDPSRGAFVLARTSNSDSALVQEAKTDSGEAIYLALAHALQSHDNAGLVMGATHPEAIKTLRATGSKQWLLLPGLGAQGADLQEVLAAGGDRLLFSASRSILYASSQADFAVAAREVLLVLHQTQKEAQGF